MPAVLETPGPFAELQVNTLRSYAGLLEQVDGKDLKRFQEAIAMAKRNGISSRQLAATLEVSEATISRWAQGKSAPQPFMRPIILSWIREKALEMADALSEDNSLLLDHTG